MNEITNFLKQLINDMSKDYINWKPISVVEIKKIEDKNECYATVEGENNLYKKKNDDFIVEWMDDDCKWHGYMLKPLNDNMYLKISYDFNKVCYNKHY